MPHDHESASLNTWTALCSATLQNCQTRYEGTDAVINHLGDLIDRFSSGSTSSELPSRSPVSERTRRLETTSIGVVISGDYGCSNFLQTKPRIYSHIVAALDIALSRGRMPQNDDFPVSLRLMPRTGGLTTTPRLSVFSNTLQDKYEPRNMVSPPASTLDLDLGQIRDVADATENSNRCQGLNDISPQPTNNAINELVGSRYDQEDQKTEMLRQLLEGYAEAGMLPGLTATM